MTQEEFKERMNALNVKLDVIKNEIRELQKDFAATYPIQKGDKCVNENGVTCWLSRIVFIGLYATTPLLLINYSRKEGTRSKREEYYYGELTKVEQ